MSNRLRPTQIIFLILVLLAVLIPTSFFAIQQAASDGGDLPEFENLSFISATAYLFFLAGMCGLRSAFRRRSSQPTHPFSWIMILVLAYAIPVLISWLPELVTFSPSGITRQLLQLSDLLTWQPWLPVLQAFALVILLIAGGEVRIPNRIPDVSAMNLVTAAVWGLGLWLVMVFTYRLAGQAAPVRETMLSPDAPLLTWLITLVGLTLLPIGEELVFRGRLLKNWQSRHGLFTGSLLSAAVFSLACMRPLVWLPAFFMGISLNWLAQRSPGLQVPILAHAAINLLVLLFIPPLLL